MHTQKLHYISQNPGASSTNLAVATSVFGLIGTPPSWRRHSRLCWKQGVCHLIEDIITPQVVSTIYALGPHYMGSLQAPQIGKQSEPINPLVAEERVMFGLNAKAMSNLTLAKIRKVYSRADNKAIAKQLGMSSHENATPIRLVTLYAFCSLKAKPLVNFKFSLSNNSIPFFKTEFCTILLDTWLDLLVL